MFNPGWLILQGKDYLDCVWWGHVYLTGGQHLSSVVIQIIPS